MDGMCWEWDLICYCMTLMLRILGMKFPFTRKWIDEALNACVAIYYD